MADDLVGPDPDHAEARAGGDHAGRPDRHRDRHHHRAAPVLAASTTPSPSSRSCSSRSRCSAWPCCSRNSSPSSSTTSSPPAPFIPWWFIWLGAIIAFLLGYSLIGGRSARRLLFGGVAALRRRRHRCTTCPSRQWLLDPGLGPVVIAVDRASPSRFGVTELTAGTAEPQGALHRDHHGADRHRAVVSAAIPVLRGHVALDPARPRRSSPSLVGIGDRLPLGRRRPRAVRPHRRPDRVPDVGSWSSSTAPCRPGTPTPTTPPIRGRPIKTIGDTQQGLEGDFWIQTVDLFTHLLLPTMALILISLASYTRYSGPACSRC